MTKKLWSLICATALLLFSCSPPVAKYSVPQPKLNTFTVMVERDYETVWRALIDHISQTSFGIENFEKSSGLIVLAFSGVPNTFVDCGDWSWQGGLAPDFQGSYIQWLERQGAAVSLSGKMNVSVYKMEETVTRVRVNARYVLTMQMGEDTATWTFDSGSSDSVPIIYGTWGIDSTRMCRPSYELEAGILEAVKVLSGNT